MPCMRHSTLSSVTPEILQLLNSIKRKISESLNMETTRQNKIARLIQKELSDIFLLQAKSMNGVIVSVTNVRVTPDLSIAHAYISVFPSGRSEEIVNNLNANMKSIRYDLGTRVRFQLRVIPELKFHVDDSLDYLEHIDELLKK